MPLDEESKLIEDEADENKLLRVVVRPHPFKTETITETLPAGCTLKDILDKYQKDPILKRHCHIFINDAWVPRQNWHLVRPKPGMNIAVRVVPSGGGGGKNPLRTILMIGVMIAAMVFAPYLAPVFMALGASATTASLIATVVISAVGNLLVNAIAPIRPPKLPSLASGGQQDSPTAFIQGARNGPMPYGVIPRPLGRTRMVAPLGALTYSETVGKDQYLRMLLVWGYGPLAIEEIKIGETPLTNFTDYEIEHRYGYPTDTPHTLFPNQVFEEPLEVQMRWDLDTPQTDYVVRTTQDDADEISVDITFPNGFVYFNSQGTKTHLMTGFDIEYSPHGANTWTYVKNLNIVDKTTAALRTGWRWSTPARGKYDVRIRRNIQNASNEPTAQDSSYWTALRTITNKPPIDFPYPLATTALRIKATDQTGTNLEALSAIVTSIFPDYDFATGTWIERATQNPASIYRGVLQGGGIATPLPDSRIHTANLQDWHDFCRLKGFKFNMVRDFNAGVFDCLQDISASGRASPTQIDNKWGVVIDREQSVPVQHFSGRNSWGFQATKQLRNLPHGWRVRFRNEQKDYKEDERIVYDDGYDANNATLFEQLQFPGVTDPEAIWKLGRYYIACARLRPEIYQFYADVGHLVCSKGKLIRVAHDVPLWGRQQGLITEVHFNGSGEMTSIDLDETILMVEGEFYAVRIRTATESVYAEVVTVGGEWSTIEFLNPIGSPNIAEIGDMVLFGKIDEESAPLVVLSIEPGENETARITCLDYSADIYNADQGAIPPFNSHISDPPGFTVPAIVNKRADDYVLLRSPDGSWQSRILVSIVRPSVVRSAVTGIETQYRLSGSNTWQWLPIVDSDTNEISIFPVDDKETYEFRLRYVLNGAARSEWTAVQTILVTGKTLPPPFVDFFDVNVQTDGTRQFLFKITKGEPLDLDGYEIRYKINTRVVPQDSEWDSLPTVYDGVLKASPWETNTLAAGSYAFGIKAKDTSRNYSATPNWMLVELPNPRLSGVLLLRDEDLLGWPGTKTQCFVNEDNVLKPSAATGGTWDAGLGGTWDGLAGRVWDTITARSPNFTYETPVIDLAADIVGRIIVNTTGLPGAGGAIVVEMRSGKASDGTVTGSYDVVADIVGKRFLQFRVLVNDPAASRGELSKMQIIVDGETVVVEHIDINTATEASEWFSHIGAGHFLIGDRNKALAGISQASIVALHNVGAGWTWELISKAQTIQVVSGGGVTPGGQPATPMPAAEFKIYNGAGALTDCVCDITLRGPRGVLAALSVPPPGGGTGGTGGGTGGGGTGDPGTDPPPPPPPPDPGAGPIIPVFINKTAGAAVGATASIAVDADVPAGRTIFVYGSIKDSTNVANPTCTDSAGNTYVLDLRQATASGQTEGFLFRCSNNVLLPAGGTINLSGLGVDSRALTAFHVGGLSFTSPKLENAQTFNGTGSTTPFSGNATVTWSNTFVLGLATIVTVTTGTDNFVGDAAFTDFMFAHATERSSRIEYISQIPDADSVIRFNPTLTVARPWISHVIAYKTPASVESVVTPPPPAPISPVLIGVRADAVAATTAVIPVATAVPAGMTIFVAATDRDSTNVDNPTCTDSAGNTYVRDRFLQTASGQTGNALFRCSNNTAIPAGGTITVSGLGINERSAIAFYTDGLALTSPVAAQGGNFNATGDISPSSGAVDIGYTDTFILGVLGLVIDPTGSDNYVNDPDFVQIGTGAVSAQRSTRIAYAQQSAVGTQIFNPSLSVARPWLAQLVAYKKPTSVVGLVPPPTSDPFATALTTITQTDLDNNTVNVFNETWAGGKPTVWAPGTAANTTNAKWSRFICNGAKWLNDERQIYTYPGDGLNNTWDPFSVSAHDGKSWMKIQTRATPSGELANSFNQIVQSGCLSNHRYMHMTYGYREARIILPPVLTGAGGAWPAFWGLYGDNGYNPPLTPLWPPEMDEMEWVYAGGVLTKVHVNGHWWRKANTMGHMSAGGFVTLPGGANINNANLYGSFVHPNYYALYINRTLVYQHANPPMGSTERGIHYPMHFIFNIAFGGSWPGPVNLANQAAGPYMEFTDVNAWQIDRPIPTGP